VKIIVIHNEYGTFSGEEAVVQRQVELVANMGHHVCRFSRSSAEIPHMRFGRVRAFCSGIYSFSSKEVMRELLREHKPDIVHIHNLFPLISPSIPGECTRLGVPVVMTVHNYRLVCPNGLHMPKNSVKICERCCGGREYWCILKNCEVSLPKSLGYAIRNYVARKARLYLGNVSIYACLTHFQKRRLIAEGYPEDRMAVVPNMAQRIDLPGEPSLGEYAGFVGRLSPEKGVAVLLQAAKSLSNVRFAVAGDYSAMRDMVSKATANIALQGHIPSESISSFYQAARLIVLPSTCFEGFPMTILEAMVHARPVVAPRIGGIPEIVDDGITGLLFEPGNAKDLAQKIQYLWDCPDLCRQMGQAGQEKALREYSPEKHYDRLMAVYKKAIELGPGGFSPGSQGR